MSYTVMIIDDDATTHEILGSYLEFSGYAVRHAYNGREGLHQLQNDPADLILLDVQMPEMDGFQTLEQFRRDQALVDIPVLMLTSLDRSNLKVKGLEMGADDYIIKPFNRAEILARIKAALRRCSRYRRDESALSGDFSAISLAELLQTMELGRRSAELALPDIPGRILFENGLVVYAEQHRFTGKDALQRIMFLERGRFSITLGMLSEPPSREEISVNFLLLDTLTYLDELGVILGAYIESDCMVTSIAGELPGAPSDLQGALPLPCRCLVCLLTGDLKENAAAVAAGINNGSIEIEN